jgi:hypothetical protein
VALAAHLTIRWTEGDAPGFALWFKIATHARANFSSVARRLIAVTECQRITHQPATDVVREKPSSIQPVTPPIIILTGRPNRARRTAALLAPLQCGPAQ